MTLASPESWRALGSRSEVLGRSIFGIATGPFDSARDKPESSRLPLVLVHGFPTSSLDWSAALPLLAERRRVLALDLLGFGFSEKPWPHEYSLREQTDLLEAWLEQRAVRRAHLLAHDMGDTVIQELLARRLEGRGGVEPASIVLLNGGLLVERVRPILAQRVLRRPLLGKVAARLMGRRAFARSLRGIAGKPHAAHDVHSLWTILEEGNGRRCYPGLIRYMDERVAHRDRWRRATLEHRFPMRLVWGDRDPISSFPIAEEIAATRPATDVVRLEGTGHYPQIEEPERVARAVLEWCERHEG